MNHYSQNDEQEVILEFFKGRIGRFLDIGAYDGVTFSNTRALLELGWHGVLVEPNPESVVLLLKSVREFHKRTKIIAAAVASSRGVAMLQMDDTPGRAWASTLVQDAPSIQQPSPMGLFVPTITADDLYDYGQFEFISIDAEYTDFEILMTSPLPLPSCELLCIEPKHTKERERMKMILHDAFGFIVHHETPENLIVRRK